MRFERFDALRHAKYIGAINDNALLDWYSIGEPLSESNARNIFALADTEVRAFIHMLSLKWRERNCDAILTLIDNSFDAAKLTLESFLSHCYGDLDLHAVYVYSLTQDDCTARAAQSLGMEHAGILRSRVFFASARHDVAVWASVRQQSSGDREEVSL